MASEALEQIVEPAFGFGQHSAYQTLDVYTSGLAQMYTSKNWKLEPTKPLDIAINYLLWLDLNKSTPNTTIIKEDIGPIRNTYIHHDGGPGRMETVILPPLRKDVW